MYEFISDPQQIEKKSMEIIAELLEGRTLPPEEEEVVKRIVHATADPDYAAITVFSPRALAAARNALQGQGCRLVADTQMIVAGINKALLACCGGEVTSFVGDRKVQAQAAAEGITRSMAAIRHAARLFPEGIYVVGNAPTALFELLQLTQGGQLRPALVVGVPVGFVGATESKEALLQTGLPYITVRGRKGGSTVAVAIVNALLKMFAGKGTPITDSTEDLVK
ncbi:MAG: precorrin-8X methylmutase [Bacillota bacterium]